MTEKKLHTAKDKDLIASLAAMKRAAALAREQAIQTNTAIILEKGRKIVRMTAADIHKESKA